MCVTIYCYLESQATATGYGAKEVSILYFIDMDSPVGKLWLISDGMALRGLHFDIYKRKPVIELGWIKDSTPFEQIARQLSEYFSGQRHEFELKLSYHGTPFQERVWNFLDTIPYGQYTTYKDVACMIGYPNAARAVGTAIGSNHISIIVPCHRVLGSGGRITGYGGGVRAKQYLLRLEEVRF